MKKIYAIILLGLLFNCSSDDNPQADTNNPAASLLVYTTANIGGTQFNAEISSNAAIQSPYGASNSYQPQQNNNGGCININYSPSLFPTFDETLPYVGVGFIQFISEANLTCSDELANFDTLFPVASYDYAANQGDFGGYIEYATKSDGSGSFYTSYGAQDSSASFEITAIEAYDCGFSECLFLTGTFSCKLYNQSDNTDVLDVTNGTFKLSIKSFNP